MSKRSNTFPYTNARREGRTTPGAVEVIEAADPRHWTQTPRYVPNRADLRRRLQPKRNPMRSAGGRRIARARCQHGTVLPYPWSTRTVHCRMCAAEVTALLAKQAAEAAARAEAARPRRGRRVRAAQTQDGER